MQGLKAAEGALRSAVLHVVIGLIASFTYLSLGVSDFWSLSPGRKFVDWTTHQSALYLAACALIGWLLHRIALYRYWRPGGLLERRMKLSLREYHRRYPKNGPCKGMLDGLIEEIDTTPQHGFTGSDFRWNWADTWRSALDSLYYGKKVVPGLVANIRTWTHIVHGQMAARYAVWLGLTAGLLSIFLSCGNIILPEYFFGRPSVRAGLVGGVVAVSALIVSLIMLYLDRIVPRNVAQMDVTAILIDHCVFHSHLQALNLESETRREPNNIGQRQTDPEDSPASDGETAAAC